MAKDNRAIFDKRIDKLKLNLSVKQFSKRSGKYILIKGKYDNNDTIYSYVLYSNPFSLGVSEDTQPMKRISSGNRSFDFSDFFVLLSPTDSRYYSAQAMPMPLHEKQIINAFDSLTKLYPSFNAYYTNYFQDLKIYDRYESATTDNGLFTELK